MDILQYLIGATGITATLILLGKAVLKWLSNAGIEAYKSDLQKETLKFQSNLNKELEVHKIRYNALHLEQVIVIKTLYSKLIKAEKPLEYLMRPIKLSPSKTPEEMANEVVRDANDFFDYFDINEIIFNEETCKIITSIKQNYIEVWNTYSRKQFMETISIEK